MQDYDVDLHFKKRYECYPYLKANVNVDCFKALIYGNQNPFPDENSFLEDMKKLGFQEKSVYKTGKILMKKDSFDMTIIDKKDDMEIEYAFYSFKTLG